MSYLVITSISLVSSLPRCNLSAVRCEPRDPDPSRPSAEPLDLYPLPWSSTARRLSLSHRRPFVDFLVLSHRPPFVDSLVPSHRRPFVDFLVLSHRRPFVNSLVPSHRRPFVNSLVPSHSRPSRRRPFVDFLVSIPRHRPSVDLPYSLLRS